MKPPLGARLQHRHPLADGLVLSVPFSEGSGSSVHDGARGLLYPSRTSLSWVATRDGYRTHQATDGSILFPDDPVTFAAGEPFTFCAAFYSTNLGSYNGICADEYTSANDSRLFTGRTTQTLGGFYIATELAGGFYTADGLYGADEIVVATFRRKFGSDNIEWVRLNDTDVNEDKNCGSSPYTLKVLANLKHSATSLPLIGGLLAFHAWDYALGDGLVDAIHDDYLAMYRRPSPIELWSAATQGGGAPAAGADLTSHYYYHLLAGGK